MYRLIHFEAENFIGIYNGLGRKKIKLNLRKYKDKKIFVMSGDNAKGKSTLLSILHVFSVTTDKRDKFIRENEEGYKLLIYEDITDENRLITVKHVYVPNKNGGHATKSYIFKEVDGNELDLNPNGNVSSFISAVGQEFGIDEDFLKLTTQNEDMAGLVKMTAAARKDHMYNFIPKADDTTVYQKVISRKYRDIKTYLSSIVDKLGKMEDKVTIKEKLKEVESLANELAEKRDKVIGKINKYEAELNTLDPDGKLDKEYREIKSSLKELEKSQEKLLSKLENYSTYNIKNSVDVNNKLNEVMELKSSIWEKLIQLRTIVSSKKHMKANLYDQISEKEQFLNQLSGDTSKTDIETLIDEYEEKLKSFDKRLSKLNTSITAEELIRGIDVIGNLREFMFSLYNECDSKNIMNEAISVLFDVNFEDKYLKSKSKLDVITEKVNSITSSIDKLSGYEYLKESVNKRPKDCVIDSCAFLQDYHKWTIIDQKIKTFEKDLKEVNDEYTKLIKETEKYYEIGKIKTKLEGLLAFYRSNYSLLSKLPSNDKYSTQEKLLKRISDYDTLVGVEDDFYDLIEILQEKTEYEDIRNVKLPNLKLSLERLNSNRNIVDGLKKDIKNLNVKYDNIVNEIKKQDSELEELEETFENISNNINELQSIKDYYIKIDDNKKDIIKLSERFESIQSISNRMEELVEKLNEKKEKLKLIENKLRPLTKERDTYKYYEIRISEYEFEKEILEENLKIVSLVRDALSTNKGMAVSILNMYVDEIRKSSNMLLSETFDGTLYLEKFEIDDKEFLIPFTHNGDKVSDISKASSSEKAFISSCLSMAIIEQIITKYGILNLDEVDGALSSDNKAVYFHILMRQINRIGISQVFMITHSQEYFEPFKDDVCFILFPGSKINKDKVDYIDLAA